MMVLLNALFDAVSCVYSKITFTIISVFQNLIKGVAGIKEGSWKKFSKCKKRGGGVNYSALRV